MTGVIYARYSSDNQREESIEGQIRENMAYAKKHGIDIIETYIDRAFSAKTDNRPEFQRMIRDSAKKTFDVVIVWKLDRFSRNRYDSAKYKAVLRKNDVRVMSATESIAEGPEGIILEAMLEGMAEYYSADLAEKVSRGMTENALKCKFNGGASAPYGYIIDAEKHYQVNPETAPIVLEIFTRYAEGETTAEIIRDLNNRGLKTSRNQPFNHNSFRNMILNTNYIGVYHYKDIVTPGGVPALVPEDLFYQAQERLHANKRMPGKWKAKERYLLTTKLYCGKCQTMMVGDSSTNRHGTLYRYYKCAAAKRHECDKAVVRKEEIEDAVIQKTMEFLSDEDDLKIIVDEIVRISNRDSSLVPALEARLNEVQTALSNIMKAVEKGIVSKTTQARLAELEEEEEKLKTDILREKFNGSGLTAAQVWYFLDKYRHLDMSEVKNRQKLIDHLVGRIILFDDRKVILAFHYKKEPVIFNLDDIIGVVEGLDADVSCSGSPNNKDHPFGWSLLFL